MINYFKKHPELLVSLVFTAIACFVAIYLLYDSYRANAFDLGIFTEAIKNTLKGMPLYNTMEGFNHLAIHFSPILFTIVPFYWLFHTPITLIVIQAILVGFASYLIYYIARYLKLSRKVSMMVQILFCVNPLVWGILLFDFHEVCFALPLLLLMIIGLLQKRWLLFSLALFFALMVKEDITLTIGALGVSLFIYNYLKCKKIKWSYIVMMVAALMSLIIAVLVSWYLSKGESPRILAPFTVRYASKSDITGFTSVWNWLANMFDLHSLVMILAYFVPLLFLPFGTIEWAFPAFGILLINMASTWYGQHCSILQYPAGAIPFLFVGVMMTLSKSKKLTGMIDAKKQNHVMDVFGFLIAISIIVTFMPSNRGYVLATPNKHSEAVSQVLNQIPDNVTVTANNMIEPHIVSRDDVYLAPLQYDGTDKSIWGFPDTLTQYLVVDDMYIQYTLLNNGTTSLTKWEDLIQPEIGQYYTLIYQLDGCKLYELRSDVK